MLNCFYKEVKEGAFSTFHFDCLYVFTSISLRTNSNKSYHHSSFSLSGISQLSGGRASPCCVSEVDVGWLTPRNGLGNSELRGGYIGHINIGPALLVFGLQVTTWIIHNIHVHYVYDQSVKISLSLTLFYVFDDVSFISFGVSALSLLHNQQVTELSFLFDDVFSQSFGYYQR